MFFEMLAATKIKTIAERMGGGRQERPETIGRKWKMGRVKKIDLRWLCRSIN